MMFGLLRTGLHVTVDEFTLRPGFALGGSAVDKAEPQGALLLGDLPVLPADAGATVYRLGKRDRDGL